MSRFPLFAVVAISVFVGSGLAQKSQGLKIDYGKVTNVDTLKSKLWVRVEPKNGAAFDKDYAIEETTKLVLVSGEERSELTGKDRLKSEKLKEGIVVRVYSDADGKIMFIEFTVTN